VNDPQAGPLAGRRVVTTRDAPGDVDRLLAAAGADVVHVPLIEIVDAADGGAALDAHLARLDGYTWLVVTSRHGARRVGAGAAAASVGLAAVGTATASVLAELAGRAVDVVPAVQTAAGLLAAFPASAPAGERILLAQADRAGDELAEGLRHLGYRVDVVEAYRTVLRRPSLDELAAALDADAVAFASGSAVQSWIDAIGVRTPPCAVAIGPSTAATADRLGLAITHVAAEHDVAGLVAAVVDAIGDQRRP
jgi:uroporphyrinogen-III synthase